MLSSTLANKIKMVSYVVSELIFMIPKHSLNMILESIIREILLQDSVATLGHMC